mmetsp:Transcript_31261/g.50777  ORF Transcript_31261/g.50777 Transcript_31261/m.50777 type:complete len:118 (-) Transcript_31261:1007-1360(-)
MLQYPTVRVKQVCLLPEDEEERTSPYKCVARHVQPFSCPLKSKRDEQQEEKGEERPVVIIAGGRKGGRQQPGGKFMHVLADSCSWLVHPIVDVQSVTDSSKGKGNIGVLCLRGYYEE